jgi:hypothetical protein
MEFSDAQSTPVDLEPAAADPAADPSTTEPTSVEPGAAPGSAPPANMLPGRERRRFGVERLLTRIIATCGIVGIGVLLGAILVSQKVAGWIDGLVIAGVTVLLAAILWSSRQL